jgi:hypothetical protein
VGQKRALSESSEPDIFDRLKRTKLATIAPSTISKTAEYQSLQGDHSEKILDDRPVPDDIPPISLLYEGFGHFFDIIDGRDNVLGIADVDSRELRRAVDELADKMTGFFGTEHERRDTANRCLNRIFSARKGVLIAALAASSMGSATSDGHNIVGHGAGSIVVEFKNWLAGISSLPSVELVGYIARLTAQAMGADNARRELFLRWRVPCLGLTIVGEL